MAEPGTSRLLRGTGPDLGPLATRLPEAERTLHHVLAAQVEERPDHDWLVFDGVAPSAVARSFNSQVDSRSTPA
jgi:hypothetical protein